MTTMFSKIKNNTNLDYDTIYAKIKEEKLALEIEEINIKKAELELKKRKIEYETKKFDDTIKQEVKKEKIENKNKKQEQKYFKEHKYKFKKILEELVIIHEKNKIILEFISYNIKKTGDNCTRISKKGLLNEFTDWFKQEYNFVKLKRKIPKDFELYNLMTKKFGLPDSTRGWIGLEFVRDNDDDFIINL